MHKLSCKFLFFLCNISSSEYLYSSYRGVYKFIRPDREGFASLSGHRDTSLILRHCRSVTVTHRLPARVSTTAALRAYRTKKEPVSTDSLSLFSCVTLRTYLPGRYLDSLLRPGTLTAPGRFYLMLLRSRPDMVHRFPSRKTQTSTPLIKGSSANIRPPCNITPTIADCGYKVPLTPRLHGFLFYIIFGLLSMLAFLVFQRFFSFFLCP